MVRNRIAVGVAGAAFGVALMVAPASADVLAGVGCSQPCPPGGEVNAAPAEVLPASAVAPAVASPAPTSGGALALTGADIAEMAALGVGAIGVGAVLRRRSRARA